MERMPPTRMALLSARSQLRLASRGVSLLHSKREELTRAILAASKALVAGRERLDEAFAAAARWAALAAGLQGAPALESLGWNARRTVPLAIEPRRVWGVPVFEVRAPRLVRGNGARGSSPLGWTPTALEAARRHEEALELLLAIATRELQLRALGEELRRTSRTINALERFVIPRLEGEVDRIGGALDEREREDRLRRKRFKPAREGALRPSAGPLNT